MMRQSSNLNWLQGWYLMHCNGDWEHEFGIKIETLDNPGWLLKIDLIGTVCEDKPLDKLQIERSEDDWFHVGIEKNIFKGACGPTNLEEMIGVFRNWVADVVEGSK